MYCKIWVPRNKEDKKVHLYVNGKKVMMQTGSSCGSDGNTVTSNSRVPQFESSHRQI